MTMTQKDAHRIQDEQTALYRLYSASDKLLYVGISKHPKWRMKEHAQGKWWWWQVHRGTIEYFEDRASAAEAELAAIRTEAPIYNLSGANLAQAQTHHGLWCPKCWQQGRSTAVEPWDDMPDPASLTWLAAYACRICGLDWTASWDYPTGDRLEYEAYDPWEVFA